jgi:hypothetical protein
MKSAIEPSCPAATAWTVLVSMPSSAAHGRSRSMMKASTSGQGVGIDLIAQGFTGAFDEFGARTPDNPGFENADHAQRGPAQGEGILAALGFLAGGKDTPTMVSSRSASARTGRPDRPAARHRPGAAGNGFRCRATSSGSPSARA